MAWQMVLIWIGRSGSMKGCCPWSFGRGEDYAGLRIFFFHEWDVRSMTKMTGVLEMRKI